MSETPLQTVRVRAPASSANLGPGFDCAGLCLSLYHELTVREFPGEGLEIRTRGEGADSLPHDEGSLVYDTMRLAFKETGRIPGRLVIDSHSEIPLARGLGSSAAAALAGLAAGFALVGVEVGRRVLLDLAMGTEGHADNAAPCLYGGFTLAWRCADGVRCLRLEVPAGLSAVVAMPDFTLPTWRAREVLPTTVALEDAVCNQSGLAMLVAAMATGQVELLGEAMVDRLHQPFRAPLVPGFEAVCAAASAAGALGVALSGSGPTVIALVRGGDGRVGQAMGEAWHREGTDARVLPLAVDSLGLRAERLNEGEAR